MIVGLSTRALAESARRGAFACVSVDAFGDLDQKAIVENVALGRDLGRAFTPGAAARVADRFPGGPVVYGSNFENHPAAVARLARGRELLGNPPPVLEQVRDWRRLRAAVRDAGGRVPETLSAAEADGRDPKHRWLRKPVRGGGGSGIRSLEPGARLAAHEMAQEQIEGVAGSVSFVADGTRAVVLGFARSLAGDARFGASGFRYSGSLYPWRLAAPPADALRSLASALTRAFGLVGLNGLDVIVRDGAVLVLELNPRYCASMELVERASGASLFAMHVAACRGALPAASPATPPQTWGKAVLWARADALAPDTRSWLGRDDVRDVPAPGERLRRGHPVCTLLATAATAAACEERLVQAAAACEATLAQATGVGA